MAPKKPDSSSRFLRRRRASFSSIRPAERSASIAICLPGMESRWKRAATSAMRPEPLVMTTKLTITRMVKTMMPMMKFPAMTKLPNAWITWPAASVPSWPRARMRRVEARLSASRNMVAISSTVGKAENSSGAWMNRDVIRISTEKVIEMASAKSSRSDGSGRMRIDENGHHADGQPEVAALEQRSEIGKARKRQRSVAAVGRSYNVGHAVCLRPSIAVTCCEAMRGGCGATGTHERKRRRARVQDCPKAAPEGAVETDYGLTSPGKICRVYGYRRVNFRRL